MNIYVHSLGCKLNQSEAEGMERLLIDAGYAIVGSPAQADAIVVNSCAVTQTAARKTRQALRHLSRLNPHANIFVLGCYAQLWPAQLAELPKVTVLSAAESKERIAGILRAPQGCPTILTPRPRRRTRAFVKVQDGCNNLCAYCVVRLARGQEQSRPLPEILRDIRELAGEGVKEVVLTGVHVGAYGTDCGSSLGELVRAILSEVGIARLRLSSIEPWHLRPEMLELWQNSRLCRHLHLPLQSGCDATLRRMNRRYSAEEYASLVEAARRHIPGLGLTTDVMVGFPGESEEEFSASLRFVEQIGFSRLHVFRYSPRPDTPAAKMPQQVPKAVSQKRSEAMREVGQRSGLEFRKAHLGRVLSALWETSDSLSGYWEGLTDNYLRVRLFADSAVGDLYNRICLVEAIGLQGDALLAQPIPSGSDQLAQHPFAQVR